MKIVVSACLAGENCKYNGGNNYSEKLADFAAKKKAEIIKVCPEILGVLPVPRVPCEIVAGKVMSKDGKSTDREFRQGAAKALEIVRRENPDLVILQSRSPSCGVNQIYDGSFSGKKISGQGIFASLVKESGFKVIDIEELQ